MITRSGRIIGPTAREDTRKRRKMRASATVPARAFGPREFGVIEAGPVVPANPIVVTPLARLCLQAQTMVRRVPLSACCVFICLALLAVLVIAIRVGESAQTLSPFFVKLFGFSLLFDYKSVYFLFSLVLFVFLCACILLGVDCLDCEPQQSSTALRDPRLRNTFRLSYTSTPRV